MSTHFRRTSQRYAADASLETFGGGSSHEERVAEHSRGYYPDGSLRYEQQRVGMRRQELVAPPAAQPLLRSDVGSATDSGGGLGSGRLSFGQRLQETAAMMAGWLIITCILALGAGVAHVLGGFWLTGAAVAFIVLFIASLFT